MIADRLNKIGFNLLPNVTFTDDERRNACASIVEAACRENNGVFPDDANG
jgi:hypothetical protein